MEGPPKMGAPTGARLKNERKGAIYLIIFVTSALSSRRPPRSPAVVSVSRQTTSCPSANSLEPRVNRADLINLITCSQRVAWENKFIVKIFGTDNIVRTLCFTENKKKRKPKAHSFSPKSQSQVGLIPSCFSIAFSESYIKLFLFDTNNDLFYLVQQVIFISNKNVHRIKNPS